MKSQNEDGYVLVLGIIIIAVLIILMVSMTNMIGIDLSFYRNNRNSSRAFYAAESGLAYGPESFLNRLDSLTEGESISSNTVDDNLQIIDEFDSLNINLNNADVTEINWEININNRNVIFTSTGKSESSEKELKSIYKLKFKSNSILNNAITAGGTLNSKNNQVLVDSGDENVGNIVAKDGYADGSTYIEDSNGNPIYEDDIIDSELEIPLFDSEYLFSLAENNIGSQEGIENFSYSDLLSFSDTDDLETEDDIGESFTYVHGDLDLGSNVTINGSGVLVVDGTLTMGSNININQEVGYENDYFIIIVLGGGEDDDSIIVDSKNNIAIQGFIYSESSTNTGNQFSLDGSIISKGDLSIVNSAAADSKDNIKYEDGFIEVLEKWNIMFEGDVDLKNIEGIGNIISWEEV